MSRFFARALARGLEKVVSKTFAPRDVASQAARWRATIVLPVPALPLIRPRSTESIVALTPVKAWRKPIVRLSEADPNAADTRELLGAIPRIIERQSAWITALGRKTAIERISSLLVEFMDRMKHTGRAQAERFPMPLTQSEIGDVVGLTPIHVNRVIKDLKTRGIIEARSRFVTVLDQNELRAIANTTGSIN